MQKLEFPTLVSHFPTGRQIFYVGGSNMLHDSAGTKAYITAADLIDSDGNMHCFMHPLSSCNIKTSVVSELPHAYFLANQAPQC